MKICIKKLNEKAILPENQTDGAACMDLHACTEESIELLPGEYKAVPSGIAVEVPVGYELQIRARSGWSAKHGVGLVNGIGTIDSDYRGEICAILINWGKEPFVIENGDRIAQIMINKIEKIQWNKVNHLSDTVRGHDKFGSTNQ